MREKSKLSSEVGDSDTIKCERDYGGTYGGTYGGVRRSEDFSWILESSSRFLSSFLFPVREEWYTLSVSVS
jgi:hypothetical protein